MSRYCKYCSCQAGTDGSQLGDCPYIESEAELRLTMAVLKDILAPFVAVGNTIPEARAASGHWKDMKKSLHKALRILKC